MTLSLVVVGVVLAVGVGRHVANQRRRAAIAARASAREWAHLAEDPSLVGHFPGPPFDQGHDREVTSVVRGRYDGRDLLAFDHTYETVSGTASDQTSTTHRHSVVALSLGTDFPSLSVAPAGLLSRMFTSFHAADLEVGDPDFDEAFRVSAAHEEFARDVLVPEVRAALVGRPGLSWRIEGDQVLAIREGHHLADEIEPTAQAIQSIIAAIPDRVWARVRGDG